MSECAEGKILVACIGNIFAGDDAFGVEAARALAAAGVPDNVTLIDYGIRAFDLAFALTSSWRAVVLVDAVARDGAPGDLYLLRVDTAGAAGGASDPHAMNPSAVFALARSVGEVRVPVYLVGCEPASLDDELGGSMGLSRAVSAAMPQAVRMLQELVLQLGEGVESPALTA